MALLGPKIATLSSSQFLMEVVMLVNVVDQFWVSMGISKDELNEVGARGFAYGVLALTTFGSLALAMDMILNLSGRFG